MSEQGKVVAGLTTSVDGYYAGPDDGPGCGLGVGGERLHYWVFGGPWTSVVASDSSKGSTRTSTWRSSPCGAHRWRPTSATP